MLTRSQRWFGDGYWNASRAGQPGRLSQRERSFAPPGRAGAPVPTRTLLLSAYGQAVDADCGRGHAAAEFQVAADLGDMVEHVFEITGYRDLFYGIGEFAIDDPHAGGSARVIAGY